MNLDLDRRRLLQGAASATALTAVGAPAIAQSDLIPLADFFRTPAVSQMRRSPDGKSILGVRPNNGRSQLFVFDVASRRSTTITNFSDGDVVGPRWVSANRIIFGVQDRSRGSGDQFNTGLFAIDKDAKDFKELSERGFLVTDSRLLPVGTFVYGKGVGSAPDEMLVAVWSTLGSRVLVSSQIHRLNTRTGRASNLTLGGPTRAQKWVFDRAGVPRVALTELEGVFRMHYRDSASADWQVVAEYRFDQPNTIDPLAFDSQGKLFVLARVGDRDFAAIHRWDPVTRKLDPEPVVALPNYDLINDPPPGSPPLVESPLITDDKGEIIGVAYQAEKSGTFWLDDERRKLQESLEATFPGRQVSFQGSPSDKDNPLLVTVTSDTEAPQYLIYDQGKRQLGSLGSLRPWLRPERLSPMEVYRYNARDGLSIPATLTVPRGKEKKNLPLIVLHYGGPWVRATRWGFDANVQFLASRGYAVMMPAPRASTGFGWKHFRAGWKQWGLAMQDDVTDGVKDLIARGIADPKRICIAGASYGGYMTMMGLVKDPDLYRCGINWIGVTDPELMYVEWTDFAASNSRDISLPVLLGHPRSDAEQFARTSPLRRAAEIKAPVLMAYGGSDRRVPIVNGERMRDALRAAGREVEWVVYPDEGHGWLREDNTLDFWRRVEAFLGKHMT